MPVRRVPGTKGHGVFAIRSEVDSWLRSGMPRASDAPKVAVLPFFNTGEPDQEYVSEGITETIINALSRTPRVRVMAWSTVRRYRGPDVDPRQIGRELGVRGVVFGRLIRRNSFWQVSAELVDPQDGAQIWGNQYARPVVDLQTLPHQITDDILAGLGVRLKVEERRHLLPRVVSNPEAFDLFLKARHHLNLFTEADLKATMECLERAVQLDPEYAEAYAEMAHCYTMMGTGYGDLPPREFFAKADWAARKALEIDDTLGEAHCALAASGPHRGFDWPFIEHELRRAIELSPGYSTSHAFYGTLLSGLGRFDEAIEELRWGAELDPYSVLTRGNLAFHLAMAGRLDEAEEEIQSAMQAIPNHAGVLCYMRGVIHERRGRYPEAIEDLQKVSGVDVRHTIPLGVLGYVYAVSGQPEAARGVLARLDEIAARKPVSHFSKALIYAGLHETDRALDCLERSYEEKTPFLLFLKTYPWLENLREQERFKELVQRAGLAD